jgi:DnaK suppressor protein
MLKTHLNDIKRALLAERKRVVAALERKTQLLLDETDDSTRDLGDVASASHDQGLLYKLQDLAAARLKAIDIVLLDIENGNYGGCHQCGTAIGQTRLQAVPWATRCRSCQDAIDLRERSSRPSKVETGAKGRHDAA